MVNDMPATPAKPVFLDYGKDILKSKLGKAGSLRSKQRQFYLQIKI
jgi:hypothetical protein